MEYLIKSSPKRAMRSTLENVDSVLVHEIGLLSFEHNIFSVVEFPELVEFGLESPSLGSHCGRHIKGRNY